MTTPTAAKPATFSYALPVYFESAKTAGMTENRWRAKILDLVDDVQNGKKIFVRFKGEYEAKRTGSIGFVKEIKNLDYLLNGPRYYWHRTPGQKILPYTKDNLKNSQYFNQRYLELLINWDGRKNYCNPYCGDVEFLVDYTGETEWKFELPAVPKVVAKDSLDREIKVGDFICYIVHNFVRDVGASVCFGNVTKITHEGEVWAKNVKLSDNQKSEERRVKHNQNITILTKDLMDQLMMAKLRSI